MPNNTGYNGFSALIDGIAGLVKLLWAGTVKASFKSKPIAIMYACMVGVMLLSGLIFKKCGFWVFVIIVAAIVCGIRDYIQEKPMRQKKKFAEDVFITMDFKAADGLYPVFVCDTELSEYTSVFTFHTLIPVSRWLARKEELEMYFEFKIVDIKQDPEENRIIDMFVQTKPLPEYLEWSDTYIDAATVLNIGLSFDGIVGMNLEKYPHAFIAGETGSGKSNILKCLIYQALFKNYDVILIDFKRGVSFADFSDSVEIYFDYDEVVKVLKDMVDETNNRLDKFRAARVDNINDYNRVKRDNLPRKIIFVDELAELLKTRDKEMSRILNDSIETLTRLSRAVGINLIMGIQRPDSTIISGQIKNNVSYRVCGRFVDREPSRIMLSCDAASSLPNVKGRFIVKDDDLYEVQSFYFRNETRIPRRLKKTPPPVAPIVNTPVAPIIKEEKKATVEVTPVVTVPNTASVNDSPIPKPPPQEEPKDSVPFEFDFSDFKK